MKQSSHALLFAMSCFLLWTTGCPQEQECVPGETQPCVCAGAAEGSQACNDDGDGWKDCVCSQEGTDAGVADAAVADSAVHPDHVAADRSMAPDAMGGPDTTVGVDTYVAQADAAAADTASSTADATAADAYVATADATVLYDGAQSDGATTQPDGAQPDGAQPDTAQPDTYMPDTAVPDTMVVPTCPSDMVGIPGDQPFCIDKYESSDGEGEAISAAGATPWHNLTPVSAQGACEMISKRLCTAAEWQAACEGLAANAYPYGATYTQGTCCDNGEATCNTGAQSGCEGGFTGLFDMSGNVAEITSTTGGSCDGEGDCHLVMGGSYASAQGELNCSSQSNRLAAWNQAAGMGFRCCSTP